MNRAIALDGVRGVAILLVFVWHCSFIPDDYWLNLLYTIPAKVTWTGMHLFFTLSGFLITGILLDTKKEEKYFKNFYARRFLRIFPLYYLVLLISFVILPQFAHPKAEKFASIAGEEWSYWTFLCNFTIGSAGQWRHPIVDVAWSLAVEEQFYLVWPLVVLPFSVRRLFHLCTGIIVAAFFYRAYLVWSGANALMVYVSTFSRFDALAAGAIIAIAVRNPVTLGAWMNKRSRELFWGSLVFTGAVMIVGQADCDHPLIQIVGHGVLAILGASIILNVIGPNPHKGMVRFFENRILRTFGKYSYGIYLFHLPIRALVRDKFYPPSSYLTLWGSPLPGQILFLCLACAVVLAVAALSFHWFENPLLKLKKYFEPAERLQRNPSGGSGTKAA